MNLEDVAKYVGIQKQPNNEIVVTISGWSALHITESWDIGIPIDNTTDGPRYGIAFDAIFCKFAAGIDLSMTPYDYKQYDSLEEAIASGVARLYDLGVMNTEIDFPEDSYSTTVFAATNECVDYINAVGAGDHIMEKHELVNEMIEQIIMEGRGRVSIHDMGDTIAQAKENISNGHKPYHEMPRSQAAMLIRAVAKANSGVDHPHVAHNKDLLEIGKTKVAIGRPKGTTVTARAEKEKAKQAERQSLGVWGGLGQRADRRTRGDFVEESEQVDEVNKTTLRNYISAAALDVSGRTRIQGMGIANPVFKRKDMTPDEEQKKISKRMRGIVDASFKLSK